MARPAYRSGLFGMKPEVFLTDRANGSGPDITRHVTDITVDADIDRTAGKSRCTIKAAREVVRDGDWIAPYLTVVPEVGDIVRQQMGRFRIETPTRSFDGSEAVHLSANGGDMVDQIAKTTLAETSFVPNKGMVMEEVELEIRKLGLTSVGPNLLVNPSFESQLTGWSYVAATGGPFTNGFFAGDSGYPVADGGLMWAPIFAANAPAGSYCYVHQDVTVPSVWRRLFVSMRQIQGYAGMHYCWVSVRFVDRAGVNMPSNFNIDTIREVPPGGKWVHRVAVGDIPENAATMRVYVFARATGVASGTVRVHADDIQVRGCAGDLLPASMLSLPISPTVAANRIQHMAGTSTLTVINERLAAIGHHALYTTMDGTITTRPIREISRDTASRVFSFGTDMRLVDKVEIVPSATNRVNKVVAVRQGYGDTPSLEAAAVNDDDKDPWSIRNMGESSKSIVVADAADENALLMAARLELARASEQEQLTFATVPDMSISPYDVIEITGDPASGVVGRWAVESLRWGMTAHDPLVRIGARRTRSSTG